MTRLTFAGAIFLTPIAILPSLLSQGLNVPVITAQFFGGTSLLIIVGVILDTMRQVETHLIQRHYDGFLRKGRFVDARSIVPPLPDYRRNDRMPGHEFGLCAKTRRNDAGSSASQPVASYRESHRR